MLKDLDLIDWQQLTHAYGTASDIPNLLKALTSSDQKTWEEALQKLYGNLWHQGTVYQATAVAVPFLLELLENEEVRCRDKILIYLADLAQASSDDKAMQWAKNTHHAVAQGFLVYLNLLDLADPDVRMYVLYLLSILEEHTEKIIPIVHAHFLQESDILVRASLLIYLSNQSEHADEDNQMFLSVANTESEDPLVKVVAAIILVKRLKEKTSLEILQFLLNALIYPQTLENPYRKLPWPYIYNRSLLGDISDALLLLDFQWIDLIIPALLHALAHIEQSYQLRGTIFITDVAVLSVIRALLYFTFEGKPIKENTIPFLLTTLQKSVLLTILNNEVASIFLDRLVEIMHSFGLPPYWKLKILLQ